MVLCGNEQRSHYLCILVAEKLYFNAQFYASHKIFKITEACSGMSDLVLFSTALSKDGDRILTAGGSQADAVKATTGECVLKTENKLIICHIFNDSRV